MTIIDKIKEVLGIHKEYEYDYIETFELVDPRSKLEIPDKSYLNNDIRKSKYNEYYNKFLNILMRDNSITSKDLEDRSLINDIHMYINLINKTITNESDVNINPAKLTIYKIGLERLYEDINIILITLCDIYEMFESELNSKKILYTDDSKRKHSILNKKIQTLSERKLIYNRMQSLNHLLYDLEGEYNIINNIYYASKIGIDSYLKNISIYGEKVEDLEQRNTKVSDLLLYLDKEDNYDNKENNISTNIALKEVILEKYVYKNKDIILEKKKELYELDEFDKTEENYEYLLYKIKDIEFYYLIFYNYGNNILTEEDLRVLYEIKFDILTINYNNTKENIINEKSNDIEIQVYKSIIENKISMFLKRKSPFIIALLNQDKYILDENTNKEILNENYIEDINKIINKINRILKYDENNYNSDKFLKNKSLLSFLLTLDDYGTDRLRYFYKNNYVKFEKNRELLFFFKKIIPLETAFYIQTSVPSVNKNYFDLYHILVYQKDLDKEEVEFPIGIIELDDMMFSYHDKEAFELFKKMYCGKKIILNNEIKIDNSFFELLNPTEIIYGKNIKKAYLWYGLKNIVISSNIEEINFLDYRYANNQSDIDSITIANYDESKILNSLELIKLFFYNRRKVIDYECKKQFNSQRAQLWKKTAKEAKKNGNIKLLQLLSNVNDDYFDSVDYYKYEFGPVCQTLTLIAKDKRTLTIDKKDISIVEWSTTASEGDTFNIEDGVISCIKKINKILELNNMPIIEIKDKNSSKILLRNSY